jgi:hypothetical protein
MIELYDTVLIRRSPEVVWSWLEHLPEHYLEWHPDHRGCRWIRGEGFVPGAVMEVHEDLHGKPHRLRMELKDVDPGRRVDFRIAPGLAGAFEVQPAAAGSRFIATITVGSPAPVVGRIVDLILDRAMHSRLKAMRRHQVEEGKNLKALLEFGTTHEGAKTNPR